MPQPDDRGLVDGVEVLRVERRKGEALHYLAKPLEEGASVTQEVDWTRRHDHMQQHSAQHLVTGRWQLINFLSLSVCPSLLLVNI